VKQIRKRITYANVMSSIAVFLVLGGASAYAAKKIGSNEIKGNSITTGKIKKNAVTASKIKKNSITTAKIANGAVDGSKVKDGSLTGSDINVSTLGTVPSATTASNVNGISITKFGERSAGGTAEKDVFNNGHLRITFTCDAGGAITVNAYTASDHASIQSYGTSSDTNNSDFNIADNPETISASDEQRDIVYTDESGNVVHLSYLAEEERTTGPKCILAGFAESQ
jgi:hypothetical protein